MAFTVGELSRLTGITVRALHHYDEVGLVRPSGRSAAGYRLYGEGDVLRLQQVLVLRELGMPLDAIAAAIDGAADRAALLRRHRGQLVAKRARLDAMVASIDAALATLTKGETMKDEEVKSLFDGFDPARYEGEAKRRWGGTDAYKESARRTAGYGKDEWALIKQEADAAYARLAALMREGAPPADAAVQEAVEAHRAHIDRWFYPCSRAMHRGLGEMYAADPRFTENLDRYGDGFARYLRDAFAAAPDA